MIRVYNSAGTNIGKVGCVAIAIIAAVLPSAAAGYPPAQSSGPQLAGVYVGADIQLEKIIATAVEEYGIDHGGKYPLQIEDLVPAYLPYVPIVPGSPNGGKYRYVAMPGNKVSGKYVIFDDGSLDLTAAGSVRTDSGSNCNPTACKYLMFSQARGIVGEASST